MQEAAQKLLIKSYTNKASKDKKETEPIWITDSIEKESKKRREYNRQVRKASDEEEKTQLTQSFTK